MSPLTAQPPAKDVVSAQVEDAEETRRQHRSAIKAAFIGTFIEWFDYAAYIYMSAIISRVFFPEMEGRRALIMTFALFALSFLVRPLGGIVWGHFGDKYGRINNIEVTQTSRIKGDDSKHNDQNVDSRQHTLKDTGKKAEGLF